jgi:hypothetical protein
MGGWYFGLRDVLANWSIRAYRFYTFGKSGLHRRNFRKLPPDGAGDGTYEPFLAGRSTTTFQKLHADGNP